MKTRQMIVLNLHSHFMLTFHDSKFIRKKYNLVNWLHIFLLSRIFSFMDWFKYTKCISKRVGNDIIYRLRRKRAKPFFTKFCHHQREKKREVALNKIVCVNTNISKTSFSISPKRFLKKIFSQLSSTNKHRSRHRSA